MVKQEDLERMSLTFPRALLPDEFLTHYLPYIKRNLDSPATGVTYSFKIHGAVMDNGKRQQRTEDMLVTVRTGMRSFPFKFEQGGYIGEDIETGEDIWGISKYQAMTTPGYDLDELPKETGQIIDMFKEISLEFFKE